MTLKMQRGREMVSGLPTEAQKCAYYCIANTAFVFLPNRRLLTLMHACADLESSASSGMYMLLLAPQRQAMFLRILTNYICILRMPMLLQNNYFATAILHSSILIS